MIVINNRSLEFRKLLKDHKSKNDIFLFDSRRFFDKKILRITMVQEYSNSKFKIVQIYE